MSSASFSHRDDVPQTGSNAGSTSVASEFYTMSFMEKKYPNSSSLAAMDSSVQSSPSIQMHSREQKNRHYEIIRKRSVETKKPRKTIPDVVIKCMRASERRPYSRGHMIPTPGSPITRHPVGAQPTVLRNNETANCGRNAFTFRPRTAAERRDRNNGNLKRTISRDEMAVLYTRDTNTKVLNSNGAAIAESCAKSSWKFKAPLDRVSKSSWKFKAPLDRVFCTRPSSIASSLAYAPVPDCAECILSDGSYGTVAGAGKLRINDKTSMKDKLFLVDQRPKTPAMSDIRKPMPNQKAPFGVDYEPKGSPLRRPRTVFRQQIVK